MEEHWYLEVCDIFDLRNANVSESSIEDEVANDDSMVLFPILQGLFALNNEC